MHRQAISLWHTFWSYSSIRMAGLCDICYGFVSVLESVSAADLPPLLTRAGPEALSPWSCASSMTAETGAGAGSPQHARSDPGGFDGHAAELAQGDAAHARAAEGAAADDAQVRRQEFTRVALQVSCVVTMMPSTTSSSPSVV